MSPSGVRLAPETARRIRFQGRAVRVAVVIALALAALITLLLIGIDVGPIGLATGLALAALPVPVYVFLALRIDRFEPEPLRLLAWAFFWGASGAVFIAFVLNTAGELVVGSQFGADVGQLYGGSISAPLVEESAKGLVLFLIYRWRRWELDGVLDGIVYAAMVGLGFAMTENVIYYGKAAVEGGVPLAATFFFRGVLAPFAHPIFTSMTGIGLGIAVTTKRPWLRVVAPIAGLLAAMGLHSLWNTSVTLGGGGGLIGVYFLIMVPIFLVLVIMAMAASSREGRLVARYLAPEVEAGVLTAGDAEMLSSLRERRRARRAARRDGRAARRAMKAFQLAATALAFRRRHDERGLDPPDTEPGAEERAFAQALDGLRENLGRHVQELRGEAERHAAWRAAYAAGTLAPLPPPGWHADPWGLARMRWWDGRAWTGHVAP